MKKRYINWINKHIDKEKLVNKTVLITGGNSGIGLEVAKYAAYLKMNIIITCRSEEKALKAIDEIKKEYPLANVSFYLLDTSSFSSVKNLANSIKDNNVDIDIFYSNAGAFRMKRELTSDGYERVIQTNYLGPYLLTNLLMPYFQNLPHQVKMIFTTSITAKRVKINYDDINSITSTTKYNTYAESKLLNVHLYLYLMNKCKGTNILPLLVHPGVTATPLIFKAYPRWFANIAVSFMKIVFHSPSKAALSTIALLDTSIAKPTFIGPRGIYNISGYPKENKITKHMKKDSLSSIEITKNLLKIN